MSMETALSVDSVEGLSGAEIHAMDLYRLGLALNLSSELIIKITDIEIQADDRATQALIALDELPDSDRDGKRALKRTILLARRDMRACKLRKQSMKLRVSSIQTTIRSVAIV